MRAERLHPEGRLRFVRTEGLLQVRLPAPLDLQYGDRLRLDRKGGLKLPGRDRRKEGGREAEGCKGHANS